MRNFVAKSVVVAAILTLLPVVSHASGPRVEGMGLQSDYVQDYVNIYAYPSSIVRYQNLVYGDWGRKDVSGGDLSDFQDNNALPLNLDTADRGLGAYVSLCKKIPGTWGVQFRENGNQISPAYGAQYWNRQGNHGVTLMWGDKVGSKSSIGLMLEKSGSRFTDAGTDRFPDAAVGASFFINGANARQRINNLNQFLSVDNPRNYWGVGAGWTANWSSGGRDHMAELGAHYRHNTFLDQILPNGPTTEDNGNADYAINARIQFAVSDNSYFTPVFNWYSMDRGTKHTDPANTANNFNFENKISSINLGLAETWVLRETDMLILGVSYNREKIDFKDPAIEDDPFTVTYATTPNLFGALEVHPTHWWHVRMGAGHPVWSKLEETLHPATGDVVTTWKDSPFQYAVGTGFRLGSSLDIDALLNQDFAFTGSWAGSGNSEIPFSSLSATYRF